MRPTEYRVNRIYVMIFVERILESSHIHGYTKIMSFMTDERIKCHKLFHSPIKISNVSHRLTQQFWF